MATPNLSAAIDSAHAEMRRLYCVNYAAQSRVFILENKAALAAGRSRLAAMYAVMRYDH